MASFMLGRPLLYPLLPLLSATHSKLDRLARYNTILSTGCNIFPGILSKVGYSNVSNDFKDSSKHAMLTKESCRKPCEGLFAFKYLRIPKNIIVAIGGSSIDCCRLQKLKYHRLMINFI